MLKETKVSHDEDKELIQWVGIGGKGEKKILSIQEVMKKGEQGNEKVEIRGYRNVQEIGRGGMGVVYKAYNEKENRWEAIKKIGSETNLRNRKRFKRELDVMRGLQHKNIIRIYGGEIEDKNNMHIRLEYVEGMTIDELIKKGAIDEGTAAEIIINVVKGIKEAHRKEILHRDIKPENIYITKKGNVKVMDFGLAKSTKLSKFEKTVTQVNEIIGTPNYMAPEHINGKPSKQSDIYSIGATLYHMVTSIPPYQGNDILAILGKMMEGQLSKPSEVNASVSKEIERIILKCMRHKVNRRYKRLDELEKDLTEYIMRRTQKKLLLPIKRSNIMKLLTAKQEVPIIVILLCAISFFLCIPFLKEEKNIDKRYNKEIFQKLSILVNAHPEILADNNSVNTYIQILQSSKPLQNKNYLELKAKIYIRSQELTHVKIGIRVYKKLLKKYQKNAIYYRELGRTYLRFKEIPKAEQLLCMAIKKGVEDEKIWAMLGEISYSDKKYSKAVEYYTKAIAQNRRREEYWLGKIRALKEQGKLQEALKCVQKSQNYFKGKQEIRKLKNEIQLATRKTQLTSKPQENKKRALILLHKGEKEFRAGNIKRALKLFLESLKFDKKNPRAWNCAGAIYLQKKPKESMRYFRAAIKLDPLLDFVWYNLGIAHERMNQNFEAFLRVEKALFLRESNGEYQRRYQSLLKKIGIKRQEMRGYLKGKKRTKQDIAYGQEYFQQGVKFYKTHKLRQSLIFFRTALEYDTNNSVYWYNLGITYRDMHKIKDAITAHREAIKLNPEKIEYLNALNLLLEKVKKLENKFE